MEFHTRRAKNNLAGLLKKVTSLKKINLKKRVEIPNYGVFNTPDVKILKHPDVNYFFNKKTGFMATWGKTKEENPNFSPVGPFIADIEISTICHGINNKPCKFCYKSNTGVGENMSLETFKKVFSKLGPQLTQIAFGAGDIDSNPDIWAIMEYCRNNGKNYVIPNITINGWNLTDEYADNLSRLCGAVAVSMYDPKDICYDAVKKLTDKGMSQVNIHKLVALETFDSCMEAMRDSKTDPRLEKLNAIVFLALKPRGKRNNLTPLGTEKYKELIDFAFENNIKVGFDSCSAPMFLNAVKDRPNYKELEQLCEPCESTLFSVYLDVSGQMYPCSFLEEKGEGINIAECSNFIRDAWFSDRTAKFRKDLIDTEKDCIINGNGCRKCPKYDIY